MKFDVATVLALCAFCSLLSAGVLAATKARDPFPGVREAMFAALALAGGFLLQLLREAIGEAVAVVAANGLIWTAAAFVHRACRRFVGVRPPARWPLVAVGCGVALFVVYMSLGAPYGVRAITTSALIMGLTIPSLRELARDGGLSREPARRLLFGLQLVTTAALGLRILLLLPHYAEEVQFMTPGLERTLAFVPGLLFAQGVGLALVHMHLERSASQSRLLALTDALTGCVNRRALEARAVSELAHAARHSRPLSLVIVDLDHFKRVNDTHGHAAGDVALTHTGALLRDAVRPDDVVARYGGEEFCVLLRESGPEPARLVAERLRAAISAEPVATPAGPLPLTASLGVATARADEPWEALFHRADEALYAAKRAGRDRVVVATP
jgi:diguanylate cyclase (GGDEF)-like protein